MTISLKSRLAERLQTGIPLVPRPYSAIAKELGCKEKTVLALAEELIREGVVRSFGAFVDYRRLGYEGILCGLSVPEERIEPVVALLNGRAEVTHNYLRAHEVNVWCTALVKGLEARNAFIEETLRACGCPFVMLSTENRLKLLPVFRFADGEPESGPRGGREEFGDPADEKLSEPFLPPDASACRTLALLQQNFPVTPHPFTSAASSEGLSGLRLLEILSDLQKKGYLRRIGASLNHRNIGYWANALVAWEADASRATVSETGEKACSFPWVSHCYVRKAVESSLPFAWPYTLYTMLHARDEESLSLQIREMETVLACRSAASMPTLRELKKTRFLL